ncbi:unnamed protein product, partial [Closterium sp. Naga37s-1]
KKQRTFQVVDPWAVKGGKEVLLVLDGTAGFNMLPQAREFNQLSLLSASAPSTL